MLQLFLSTMAVYTLNHNIILDFPEYILEFLQTRVVYCGY